MFPVTVPTDDNWYLMRNVIRIGLNAARHDGIDRMRAVHAPGEYIKLRLVPDAAGDVAATTPDDVEAQLFQRGYIRRDDSYAAREVEAVELFEQGALL